MDGEEDNFGGRCDLAYLVCSLDAIHDRHIDVEEDEVRMQLSDLLDSLLAIFSFAANVHGVPVQKRADRLPRYLIIVHDQDPDWHLRFLALQVSLSGLANWARLACRADPRDVTAFKKRCHDLRNHAAAFTPIQVPPQVSE